MKYLILSVSLLFMLCGCGGGSSSSGVETNTETVTIFSAEQRTIADQIISVFENNTPVIQYGYAEVLFDGRGITAGRAGFTSATGDMLEVVRRYTALEPNNALAPYLPRLETLAKNEDGSVTGLEGLEDIWHESANDPVFRNVQDDVADEYYYVPAIALAKTLGVSLPLTMLNLFDAIIQHGEGDDPDGLLAIIERTSTSVGGTPKNGVDEKVWLQEFMSIRRSVLLNPDNPDTKDEWSESVGRVDTLMELYGNGNFLLTPPVVIDPWGDTFTIPVQ